MQRVTDKLNGTGSQLGRVCVCACVCVCECVWGIAACR